MILCQLDQVLLGNIAFCFPVYIFIVSKPKKRVIDNGRKESKLPTPDKIVNWVQTNLPLGSNNRVSSFGSLEASLFSPVGPVWNDFLSAKVRFLEYKKVLLSM